MEPVLVASKVTFLMLRDILHNWFDVVGTSNWHGQDGRQYAMVDWHLLTPEDIDNSKNMRGSEDPRELFGLKWAAACGRRVGEESAWETVTRAVEQQLGVPAKRLKEEYCWINPANDTAYFRLRYTGHPGDTFVFADPEQLDGRSYRSTEGWGATTNPAVRLVASYLHIVERVPVDQLKPLFTGSGGGG